MSSVIVKIQGKRQKPSGKLFCGIDQGITGAIAFLPENSNIPFIYDMPTLKIETKKSTKTGKMGYKNVIDFFAVREIMKKHKPTFTLVERLQIAGGSEKKKFNQSAQSIATTHKHGGIMLGVVIGLSLSHDEVTATKWQNAVFTKKSKGSDSKQMSYMCACTHFPEIANELMGPRGGIKDGKCDAVLIALYARRNF